MADVDFNYFLARKYAIQQQGANADTQNAATNSQNAATAAREATANIGLTNMRTSLMPGESAATVARTRADTNLANQQASVVVPESRARVRNLDAETAYTGTQNRVLTRGSLTPMSQLFGSSSEFSSPAGSDMFGSVRFRAPRIQDYDKQTGRLSAAGLDYINGF